MSDTVAQDQLGQALPDDAEKVVVDKTEPTPEYVSRKEFNELADHAKTLTLALSEAGKRLEVIDRVAEILQGKSQQQTLTKEEQLVVSELHRLIPELKHLNEIPKVQQVVNEASKATTDTLVEAAFSYQLELQTAAGLSIEDSKANYYVGAAIKEWINQDNTRRARFWRGDRSVVKEGFDEVKKSLIDPLRGSGTKGNADIVKHRPRNAAPGGTPGAGEGSKAPDFSNSKSVREALKAALAS